MLYHYSNNSLKNYATMISNNQIFVDYADHASLALTVIQQDRCQFYEEFRPVLKNVEML